MLIIFLHLTTFLRLLLSITTTSAADAPTLYDRTDYILINCGVPSTTTSPDRRDWDPDFTSKFVPPNTLNTSISSQSSDQNPSVATVPYTTARIFRSKFTYTFPVSAGPKFLRLYFYPATYSALDKTKSFFSVTAADFTLLSNFSAFLTVQAIKPQVFSLIKEFIINIDDKQSLDLTFSPSPNSYAFINGIELVSIPENYYLKGDQKSIPILGQTNGFFIYNSTALETVYRLNAGGNDVQVTDDTGMFRFWGQDSTYISGSVGFTPHLSIPINYTPETPAYSAPDVVYTTSRTLNNQSLLYNLTWIFEVDLGFKYLIRLYFCEILMEVTKENQRVFDIFIKNQTAERNADVIRWSHSRGTPVYRDYVVFVLDPDRTMSKTTLWLAMHPNLEYSPRYANAILNGLEIFKLNQSDGSFAVPNPELVSTSSPPEKKSPEDRRSKGSSRVVPVAGGVVGGIIMVSVITGFLIFRRRKRGNGSRNAKSDWDPISSTSKSSKTSSSTLLPTDKCRRFSLEEILFATDNFNNGLIIGSGGFGNVYKGHIENGAIPVAIKRLNSTSRQGAREFQTEIVMLSNLRHLHLVSLIGYCDEIGEMILVYDYMSNGTLRSHLYNGDKPPLSWKQRLEICIGAARGLHYLHTGAKRLIIHRDVKSTNILLDGKLVAKVSDFGLSKMGPSDVAISHISTVVKGSFGYLDPEYYRRQQLTDKSDVYSFGVVLFEVLCARPAIMLELVPKQEVNLAEWARHCYRKGLFEQIVDERIKNEITPESLKKFWEVGYNCIGDKGIERPTMSDVIWSLEFALQLQEAAEKVDHIEKNVTNISSSHLYGAAVTMMDEEDVFSDSTISVAISKNSEVSMINSNSDGFKSDTVSFDIMNAKE